MPTTPTYALRYPLPTDPADGPVGFQNLATDVEAALVRAPSAAAFPASPVNGQVHRYLVSANGPVWTFVYLSASAAPYRWHFVGGIPFIHETVTTGGPAGGGAWVEFGPSFNPAPLAGDYHVSFSGYFQASVATAIAQIGFKIGTVLPVAGTDDVRSLTVQPAGANYAGAGMSSRDSRFLAVAAGATFSWAGTVNSGGLTMTNRCAWFTPIRVTG